VIDEADKLLDHHFNQWLPKILTAVEDDKKEVKAGGGQKSLTSLRNTLLSQCATSERLQLMCEDHGHSKVV
jgi:superfamily II DNA/RNA helicase